MKTKLLEIKSQLLNLATRIDQILDEDSTTPVVTSQQATLECTLSSIKALDGTTPESDKWPEAIPTGSIATSKNQKEAKADLLIKNFDLTQDRKILDFGCGCGYLTERLNDKSYDVVGYDVNYDPTWNKNAPLTTSLEDVIANGPYDDILLIDVIDHFIGQPEDEIKDIKNMLKQDGVLHVFAHPWTAPHGGHQYEVCNKAYIHLMCDDLEKQIESMPFNLKILRPMAYHQNLFAGLKEKTKDVITSKIGPWAVENIIPIIKDKHYPKQDLEQVLKILSIAGIYYQFTKQ